MSIIDWLKGYRKVEGTVFHSEQEIKNPTLFINARFYTQSPILRVLLLHHVLPVGKKVGMKIYFRNLYDETIPGTKNLEYFVNYPNTPQGFTPQRKWYFDMPELVNKDDRFYTKIPVLFVPEVPGNHTLIIPRTKDLENIQYAGIHGLAGRKYKIVSAGWGQNFHVSDQMEVRNSVLVSFALMASIITLFVSIISLIISLLSQQPGT